MIAPQRLTVKFFFETLDPNALSRFIPVFHRWIGDAVMPGEILIDVADYKHVYQGPAVVLVGFYADYIIDLAHGQAGLRYVRKRQTGTSFADALRLSLHQAVSVGDLLAKDPDLQGFVDLRTNDAIFTIPDRLRYPNEEATFAAVRLAAFPVVKEFFGDDVEIDYLANDPREPLTLRVHGPRAAAGLLVEPQAITR
jgi:hypothetical protein